MGIIISILVLILISEVSTSIVYGKFISNKTVDNYIKKYSPFELNEFSSGNIIGPRLDFENRTYSENIDIIRNGGFISKTALSLLSTYYINGTGRVLIWSKAHNQIKNLYKELK